MSFGLAILYRRAKPDLASARAVPPWNKTKKKKQAEADRIDEKGTETLLAQGHQQTPCEKSTNMVWPAGGSN